MIGREADLERLRVLLTEAMHGDPQAVAVGGEAGIGKSRLLREFVVHSSASATVLTGQCVDLGGAGTPFAPIVSVLRGLVESVGAETVLSGWSSVLPQSVLGAPAGAAAIGTTVFWTLMAAGRFACAAVLRRGVSPVSCLIVALLAAAAAAVGAALLREGVVAVILVGIAVLLVAPGYALLLGVALARCPVPRAGIVDSRHQLLLVREALRALPAAPIGAKKTA